MILSFNSKKEAPAAEGPKAPPVEQAPKTELNVEENIKIIKAVSGNLSAATVC